MIVLDPLDIGRYILAAVGADTTLRSLMGITSTDPRIYPYYSGDAVIDPAVNKRAYITYANIAVPERTAAVEAPVFSLAIWALNSGVAHDVRKRLLVLFDKEGELETTITTPAGRVYQPVKVGEHWSSQENTKFFGITLQFRFGSSAV